MQPFEIPGIGLVSIKNIVLDYNGTIACDGKIIEGLKEKLELLSDQFNVYVITADTHGTVRENFRDSKVLIKILEESDAVQEKMMFVRQLGAGETMAVGNGNNDAMMLKEAVVGAAIIGAEGGATQAVLHSDVVYHDIMDWAKVFDKDKRLIATLRR